jgi:hypothetical protein
MARPRRRFVMSFWADGAGGNLLRARPEARLPQLYKGVNGGRYK